MQDNQQSSGYQGLFKGTAYYYAKYRPGYPAAFFDEVRRRFALDGRGRLLDLGCGTGQLTLPLAHDVERAIGMDPEPEMLAEAAAAAERLGIQNVSWIEGGSYSLSPQLGSFRLVTMGSAFHWMDRAATLATLAQMIIPDGGLVIVDNNPCEQQPSGWQQTASDVVRRWVSDNQSASPVPATPAAPKERHEDVVARSPFRRSERYTYQYQRILDIETIIGANYSTSSSPARRLGNNRAAMEQELRETLLGLHPSGEFVETRCLGAIFAWLS